MFYLDNSLIRCERTGNPYGTDTWGEGYVCPCNTCQNINNILNAKPAPKEITEVINKNLWELYEL